MVMPQVCQICNHPERLAIDREIVAGKSKTFIAKKFLVSLGSVVHHGEKHLSRQLCQAHQKRDLAESMDLLSRIDSIIDRAESIFKRSYERKSLAGDEVALKALNSQRSTLELLVRISEFLHQARLAELQNNQEHFQSEHERQYAEGLKLLTTEELQVLTYLQMKMTGEDIPDSLIPDMFRVSLASTRPVIDLATGEPVRKPAPNFSPVGGKKPILRTPPKTRQTAQDERLEPALIDSPTQESEPEEKGFAPIPPRKHINLVPGASQAEIARLKRGFPTTGTPHRK
jgi:hypothetical protein